MDLGRHDLDDHGTKAVKARCEGQEAWDTKSMKDASDELQGRWYG